MRKKQKKKKKKSTEEMEIALLTRSLAGHDQSGVPDAL
jgi:hypothetical protein